MVPLPGGALRLSTVVPSRFPDLTVYGGFDEALVGAFIAEVEDNDDSPNLGGFLKVDLPPAGRIHSYIHGPVAARIVAKAVVCVVGGVLRQRRRT